jgi:hypothetical protein
MDGGRKARTHKLTQTNPSLQLKCQSVNNYHYASLLSQHWSFQSTTTIPKKIAVSWLVLIIPFATGENIEPLFVE